jgi:hypothetical protein
MHHDVTQILACAAGYSPKRAAEIAKYTQLVDKDHRKPVDFMNPFEAYEAQRDYHFPSGQRLNELYGRAHEGGAHAIGTFIHALQDSFSHSGYEAGLGHYTYALDGAMKGRATASAPGFAAGALLGYVQGLQVDITSERVGMALMATRSTYLALVSLNDKPDRPAILYSTFETALEGYLGATNLTTKRFYYNQLCKMVGCEEGGKVAPESGQ